MSIPLIATAAYSYAARSLNKGDTFEASEPHAKLLKLIGRAVDAPVAAPRARLLMTRDLEPEARESEPELDAVEPKPKRQYRRRDLVSEP